MSDRRGPTRREFLKLAAAVPGACVLRPGPVPASTQQPRRGGQLRFGTRSDAAGLDPQRHVMYYISSPLAATTQGLVDFDASMALVPGVALEWDIAPDLLSYRFRLRPGAEYHNGRTVDAESIRWNIERMRDPLIGNAFVRSALQNVDRIEVPDKLTVHVRLKEPSAVFLQNVAGYPCNVIAPDSGEQADVHPVGCGPFKFKSWQRFEATVLERFENYYETGPDGSPLPYLEGLVGLPKRDDQVRLTALRTGEVELIDNMSYAEAAGFSERFAGQFQTWHVPQVGTTHLTFNLERGPFADSSPNGHLLRQAAAHAIDRETLAAVVFNGLSRPATGFFGPGSPWHTPEAKLWPEYDPDRARSLLRKAGAVGTRVILLAWQSYPFLAQTGEIIHAMWSEVGFHPLHEIHPLSVARKKASLGEFNAVARANAYPLDPDGWFFRNLYSEAPGTQGRSRYRSKAVDELIVKAQRTLDQEERRRLYAEVESHVNTDLPLLYLNYEPLLQAGANNLRGYAPASAGPFSYAGGGVRTAWLA